MTKPELARPRLSFKKKVGMTLGVGLLGLGIAQGIADSWIKNAVPQTPVDATRLTGPVCHTLYGYPKDITSCHRRNTIMQDHLFVDRNGLFWYGTQEDVTTPRPSHLERVAQLGASTSAGAYYLELKETLNQEGTRTYQVLPGAIHGYRSQDELIRYQKDIIPLEPSVVTSYSLWNEIGSIFTPEEETALFAYMADGNPEVFNNLNPWFSRNIDYFRGQRAIQMALDSQSPTAGLERAVKDSLIYEGIQTVGRNLLEHSRTLRGLELLAHRDRMIYTPQDQSIGGPSPFDETFIPQRFEENMIAILDDAASRGIVTVLEIPPHGFGCFAAKVAPSSGGITMSVNDRYSFMTRSAPASIRRIAQEHGAKRVDPNTREVLERGAIVVDYQDIMNAQGTNACQYFWLEGDDTHQRPDPTQGDEMHMNHNGWKVRTKIFADTVIPYLEK